MYFFSSFFTSHFLYMQKHGRNVKVNHKRKCIDYGCNKRTCHNGRIKSDFFRKYGQCAAYEFSKYNGHNKRKAYNCGNNNRGTVDNKHFYKVCHRKRNTA